MKTTNTTKPNAPLYLVEVRGANGVAARIGRYSESINAHTSGSTEWCPATVWEHEGPRAPYWSEKGAEHRRVALFTSRRAAGMAISEGEIWNGQQYRVRAARGEQLREGVVINSYQAPHRPRLDPTAARVVKSYRVHPDTAAVVESESKRTGESQGQVVDRLARMVNAPHAG